MNCQPHFGRFYPSLTQRAVSRSLVIMMAKRDSGDKEMKANDKNEDEDEKLSAKEQIKKFGIAGVVSWTLWKLSFNLVSLMIAAFGYF